MKCLFLTNEFPPNIYGGAGVHADYLSRELAKLMEVDATTAKDRGNDNQGKGKGSKGDTGWYTTGQGKGNGREGP